MISLLSSWSDMEVSVSLIWFCYIAMALENDWGGKTNTGKNDTISFLLRESNNWSQNIFWVFLNKCISKLYDTNFIWCVCWYRYCLICSGSFQMRRRQWHPTPVLLPGKSHGQRRLVGCSLWGREESDTTEWLHFHFSLSCIGEGNGNPLHVLAWRIPGTGEPGGLPSMGSYRVGHDWSDLAAAAVFKWVEYLNINYLKVSFPKKLENTLLWEQNWGEI